MTRRAPSDPAPLPEEAQPDAAAPSSLPASLLPLSRVAELLSCHERTVRRWIRAGRLQAYRLPGGWRVDPADLQRFLDRHRTGAGDDNLAESDVE